MKLKLTFKDPDGVYDGISDAVTMSLPDGLSHKETAILYDSRREEVEEALGKWLRYGEYVTIEFDTETGMATVLERG